MQDNDDADDSEEIGYVFHQSPMVRYLDDGTKMIGGNESPATKAAMREQGVGCPVDAKFDTLAALAVHYYDEAIKAIKTLSSLRNMGSSMAASCEVMLAMKGAQDLMDAVCSDTEDPHELIWNLQKSADTWPFLHDVFSKYRSEDYHKFIDEYLAQTASAFGFNFKTKSQITVQRTRVVLGLFVRVNRARIIPFLVGEQWKMEAQALPPLDKTNEIVLLWDMVIRKMLNSDYGSTWQERFIRSDPGPMQCDQIINILSVTSSFNGQQRGAKSEHQTTEEYRQSRVTKVFREVLTNLAK